MKKMNNKGFSLVELIIVIAIMAILAGAIAPALIRYIDKSRKSSDVTSAKAIVTAVETALSDNDDANAALAGSTIKLTPGNKTVAFLDGTGDSQTDAATGKVPNNEAETAIMATLKETPKFKYKKGAAKMWIVTISETEIVKCYAAKDENHGVQLAPDGDTDDYTKSKVKDTTFGHEPTKAAPEKDNDEKPAGD